jgi:hypothetical protein
MIERRNMNIGDSSLRQLEHLIRDGYSVGSSHFACSLFICSSLL